MASPREGRRSNGTRLIAAGFALAALDARAHSFGLELWGIPVLIGLCGVLACFLVYLIRSHRALGPRFAIGAGLAVLDIGIWWALGFVSMLAANYSSHNGPPWMTVMWYATLGIWPWILPAYLWFKLRGRPKG